MNKELFYQLAHQASFWCDQNIPEQFSEEIMGYGEAWEEKFAELIVRECSTLAYDGPNGILEHFGLGVEE